jgi:hypothetical protein
MTCWSWLQHERILMTSDVTKKPIPATLMRRCDGYKEKCRVRKANRARCFGAASFAPVAATCYLLICDGLV